MDRQAATGSIGLSKCIILYKLHYLMGQLQPN